MAKIIAPNLIIGNAFISTGKEVMTKGEINQFWNIVDTKLPEGYYTSGSNNSFNDFCDEYGFLVKRIDDKIIVNCDRKLLERYFRIGLPTKIVNVFDDAAFKLNEVKIDVLDKTCDIKIQTEKVKTLIKKDFNN